MRISAGRLQGVGAGALVLAAVVAAPGLSAAQSGETTPDVYEEAPVTTVPDGLSGPAPDQAPSAAGADGAPAIKQTLGAAATDRAGGNTPAKAKAAATKRVSVGDNFYSPVTIKVQVGDTVTWKNNGLAVHNATADDGSFKTNDIDPGQSASQSFTVAGDYPYFCTIHGQAQSGTIKVLAASGGGGSGGGGGTGGGGGSGGTGASTSSGTTGTSSSGSGFSGSLPSTGLAVGGLALIGLALIGGGSLLKRLSTG